jgi:hypothetical protein
MSTLRPLLLLLIGASWKTLVRAVLSRPFATVTDLRFWVLDLGVEGMEKLRMEED